MLALSNAAPTPVALERPLPAALGPCVLLHDFLSPAECAALVAAAEARGFGRADTDYPPSYRDNDRLVCDDAALAARLYARLRPLLPQDLAQDADWRLAGINERLRLCRYRAGQSFRIHQDGVHHRDADVQSRLTFMVYLDDGSDFGGGDTLFYATGPGTPAAPPPVVARVRPRRGSLIVFDHALWHAGDTVRHGVKRVLRSDLLFERTRPSTIDLGHQGYVWTLCPLHDGALASAGRDAAIRLWNADGTPRGVLRGHAQSVLGLAEVAPGRIASVGRDRELRWWDLAAGRCTRFVRAHDGAALALVAVGAQRLASAGADGHVVLWSAAGAREATLAGHAGWVWALACCGTALLSAGEDGTLRLWDLATSRCIGVATGDAPLRCVDVGADGACIASGDVAGRVTLWTRDGATLRVRQRWNAHTAAVRCVRVLGPDLVASGGEDGVLAFWRADGTLIATHTRAAFVTDVVARPDRALTSCGYDGVLRTQAWPEA